MIVSEEKLEKALNFLSDSDDEFAEAKANMLRAEIRVDRAKARVFVTETGSVEERKAKARISEAVTGQEDDYIAAIQAYERLKAWRQRAEIVIDVYRTLEASRRKVT